MSDDGEFAALLESTYPWPSFLGRCAFFEATFCLPQSTLAVLRDVPATCKLLDSVCASLRCFVRWLPKWKRVPESWECRRSYPSSWTIPPTLIQNFISIFLDVPCALLMRKLEGLSEASSTVRPLPHCGSGCSQRSHVNSMSFPVTSWRIFALPSFTCSLY